MAGTTLPQRYPRRRMIPALRSASILLPLVLASICYCSFRADQAQIAQYARRTTSGMHDPANRVLALLWRIHTELPTRHNTAGFLLPSLGATSAQVLQSGGDCADKSRLLVALLRSLNIPASPVMSFDPRTNRPAHTFVEARPTGMQAMLVDPTYALSFPRPDGGYYGLLDIRRDPAIVDRQLASSRVEGPEYRAVSDYYLRPAAPYESGSTFNWNRGALPRAARSALFPLFGERLYTWPRPIFLEEPKLLIATWLLAATFVAAAVNVFITLRGMWSRAEFRRSSDSVSSSKSVSALTPEALPEGL
ncbi:MAG: transglutaminase domain-containing protein [Phycisphaerae bacterium]|nr:transglutaminase domain-containing protein [Phycisphaerae bacterium]